MQGSSLCFELGLVQEGLRACHKVHINHVSAYRLLRSLAVVLKLGGG